MTGYEPKYEFSAKVITKLEHLKTFIEVLRTINSHRDGTRTTQTRWQTPNLRKFYWWEFLNNQYRLSGTRHYRCTSQRRSAKVLNSIEQALLTTIESKTSPKFNGNLEKTPSSNENELEKLNFIKQLKRKVQQHGQQTFYTAFYQNEVVSLFEHYHKFTVEEIIDQYELRCIEPPPELDPITGNETDESRQLRFESYDEYEFDDFG